MEAKQDPAANRNKVVFTCNICLDLIPYKGANHKCVFPEGHSQTIEDEGFEDDNSEFEDDLITKTLVVVPPKGKKWFF